MQLEKNLPHFSLKDDKAPMSAPSLSYLTLIIHHEIQVCLDITIKIYVFF